MGPIPYARQEISEQDLKAVQNTLQADYLTTGPTIAVFEEKFAEYVEAPYAVAVSSGTAALHLCAKALEVGPGMRAITTPLTFAASASCILHEGGHVDFVDIDPNTGLMDLNQLSDKLRQAPAQTYQFIIPIDFAGYPVQMDEVKKIADKWSCKIIEDSCHAPGAYFQDEMTQKQKVGNGVFADLSIFSFHPTKHITTGEGGMITTGSEALYKRLKVLRNHGITKDPLEMGQVDGGWYYELKELGLNYRLSDIHASLGIAQMGQIDAWLDRRKEIARTYRSAFADSPVKPLKDAEGHAYHLFVVCVPKRKELYNYLRSHQIYCQVHYVPLHIHPLYQNMGWKRGDFPHTEVYYDSCLSLPMFPALKEEEQAFVIEKILAFYGKN